MKIQGHMFTWLAGFILLAAVVYGVWSKEPAGTTALFMAFALSIMIGYYLVFTARRVDTGAQDNKEADVADDAGELGFFSPHSWQPLSLGFGGAIAFLSIAIGWWLVFFAIPFIALGVFGWVFEYYRGADQNQ
ncbi:cytochrome c oxidase subunit 4 [Streptomyces sp. NPDC051940]|uniref:cytochrome c oxidase subunit 4 n=1 Tax=Streptomyces sp. NPDC051940 TaxID=3155675 RepID=UPI00342A5F67